MAKRATTVETATKSIAEREVFPTEMRSWALEALPTQWKRRAFFSAGVTQVEFLDEGKSLTEKIANGEMDRATARLELKKKLAAMDYKPDPDDEGTIKDLRTDRRLNLILDTQVEMARGFGQWQAGQSAAVLRAFPARELRRVGGAPMAPRPWRKKWLGAGGSFYGGLMIALTQSGIWMQSLEAGGFNRFGNPWPPFDYLSGMRVRDVSRRKAKEYGMALPPALPVKGDFNEGAQASPRVASPELRRALEKSGLGKFEGKKFVMASRQSAPKKKAAKKAVTKASSLKGGPAVGAVLEIKARAKALKEVAAATIAAIDKVHGDGVLPKIPIKKTPKGSSFEGIFSARYNRASGEFLPNHIYYDAVDEAAGMHTLTHEIGHFLDVFGLHAPKLAATHASGTAALRKWRAAVLNSDAVKSIQADRRYTLDYKDYLLQDVELWARSYAQFITEESGDARLVKHLADVVGGKNAGFDAMTQWSKKDFAPIRKEMLAVMRKKGWLR